MERLSFRFTKPSYEDTGFLGARILGCLTKSGREASSSRRPEKESDETVTMLKRNIGPWASEGFFQGGAKSGENCFSHSKPRKQSFFAKNFNIQTLGPERSPERFQ